MANYVKVLAGNNCSSAIMLRLINCHKKFQIIAGPHLQPAKCQKVQTKPQKPTLMSRSVAWNLTQFNQLVFWRRSFRKFSFSKATTPHRHYHPAISTKASLNYSSTSTTQTSFATEKEKTFLQWCRKLKFEFVYSSQCARRFNERKWKMRMRLASEILWILHTAASI